MTQDYINTPTIRINLIIINKINNVECILLAKHKKNNKQYWVLPGGHLDYGETIEECALRELKEETNLDGKFIDYQMLSESIDPKLSRHILNIYTRVQVNAEDLDNLEICSDFDILKELKFMALDQTHTETIYPSGAMPYIIESNNSNWQSNNIKQSSLQVINTPWV